LILLLLGRRGDTLLPRMRDWMNANSWVVSEAVIAFFLLMEIKTILSSQRAQISTNVPDQYT